MAWPIFTEDGLDTRTLALRALDGTYPLPSGTGDLVFMPDSEGLDMPPRDLIRQPLPGLDGTQLREIRTLEREVFIPLWLASSESHAQYLDRRDDLAGLFSYRSVDYVTEGGTFDLEASSTRGVRRLRCAYVSGMSRVMRPDEGAYWAKLGLTLLAVQPYWVGENWTTSTVAMEVGPDTFAKFELEFSSSTVSGTGLPVTISGDAPSWPTITLRGPASSVEVTGPGLLVSIPAGLADLETAVIITDPRKRTATFGGVEAWSRVGALTTWQPVNPGSQLINVIMTGASANSQATVSGATYYERPW